MRHTTDQLSLLFEKYEKSTTIKCNRQKYNQTYSRFQQIQQILQSVYYKFPNLSADILQNLFSVNLAIWNIANILLAGILWSYNSIYIFFSYAYNIIILKIVIIICVS